MKKGKKKKVIQKKIIPTKSGSLRSYASYVKNSKNKIDSNLIGSTFDAKRPVFDDNGKRIKGKFKIIKHKVTKITVQRNIKKMNDLQGSKTEEEIIKSYMKKKGFKKIRITTKSTNYQVRRALKNQKIYLEAKARFIVAKNKKEGNKITLKKAREEILKRARKYECVGGSW